MQDAKTLSAEDLAELKRLMEVATPGPVFVADDPAELTPHAHSGLALIDTGRSEDWTIASLMEWPTATFVAALYNYAPALIAAAGREYINAQHEETGRLWSGPRCDLPRRYIEIPCLPPAPDGWLQAHAESEMAKLCAAARRAIVRAAAALVEGE